MKYTPRLYAQAFLESKPDTKRFLSVVAKNGDLSKIDKIVAAIEELQTRQQGGRVVDLEFARDTDMAKKFKFKEKDLVRTRISPSLVAGVRITIDGTQEFDNSFKKKINHLWHTNY